MGTSPQYFGYRYASQALHRRTIRIGLTATRPALVFALLCVPVVACDELGAGRQLQPDHKLRAVPNPETSASVEAKAQGASLFQAKALEKAVSALKLAATKHDPEGSISVLELKVTPHELLLQAADTRQDGKVLLWRYAAGSVAPPEVVQLRGAGDLEENLFSLDGVYLKAIPRLSGLAVQHVDPQDGKVTSIVVRRNLPFTSDVRFRVFVDSPRKNGQLDANRFGHPLLG